MPNECVECYSPFVLTTLGTCEESCRHGTFESGSSCEHCDDRCETCRGPSLADCLSCRQQRVFHQGACLDRCPDGFYAEGATCAPCYSTCATCMTGRACQSCRADLFLTSHGDCLPHCRQHEFTRGDQCLDCHSTCASCHGPNATQCLGCHGNTYLHQGRCLATCPDAFFTLGNQCHPCELPCVNCVAVGAENCLTCVDGYSYEDGVCIRTPNKADCLANEFYREDTKTCESCDSSCETCSGEGSHHCLSCPSSALYHPSRHQCLRCCPTQSVTNLVYLECCLCDELQEIAGTCLEIRLLQQPPTSTSPPTTTSSLSSNVVTDHRVTDHGAVNSRAASAWKGVVTIVVLLCLLSTVVFFVVFGLLQAKAHDRLCWRHMRYEPVPMHYQNGKSTRPGKVVSLTSYEDDDEEEDEDVFSAA
ncbi:hypothetical protein CAPTEDRAFT_221897 [Capitella teleta]|uniref:Furin-like cysteine-rich domain-containing protein n=1 Tax=Capitella teleta TaxID=283909 RepID=R7T3L7_CAPTE|nr:hypothetical protein CAPTEDRAFT_221897 [Capitella teleta]|eukprot:ELT87216.1 hypothetical protein CAPTEDRAFT_221897 [Capitella teleta]